MPDLPVGSLPSVELLDGAWSLVALDGPGLAEVPAPLPATVPGCVHTDLLAAGVIEDPFDGLNEPASSWIGETSFRWERDVTVSRPAAGEVVELVLEGVDTIATVRWNGVELGTTRNMHRTHRFDVTALVADRNHLQVDIAAPLPWARDAEARGLARPHTGNPLPYNVMRKEACNFGWDWGPELVTSGIQGSVRLERWREARLAQVVPAVTVADGAGRVRVDVRVDQRTDADLRARCEVLSPAGDVLATQVVAVGSGHASAELLVPDPELWWPHDHGAQPLYELTVALQDADTVLDQWRRRIGFRTVELLTEPDEWGTSFLLRINGQAVYLRGANWIPDDVFVSRVRHADRVRAVRDALEANMNVLRIWGGGVYLDDDLADLCDEAGILVWQDFLFACAAYPEVPELAEEVAAEARENVARLAPHASLVLWNGNNENVEGFHHWGWQDQMEPGTDWGLGYYLDLLPGIVAEVDGTRPYTPTSPWNPNDLADPRNPDHGSSHSWEVWNRADYLTYRDSVPRFCAEFGFQGPATWPTIQEYVHDEPLAADSAGMLLHEKALDGVQKLADGFAPHLPQPRDFGEWHFVTSLNQARAIECGISHFRSWWPRSCGAIIWQLNDCWPVSSWAAVDSQGRRKLLWYALRELFRDRFLTVQPREEGLALVVSNFSNDTWSGSALVRRMSTDGDELAHETVEFACAPHANVTLPLGSAVTTPASAHREFLVVDAGGTATGATPPGGGTSRAWWWFGEDVDVELPPAAVDVTLERDGERVQVDVRAHAVVKDLTLLLDRQVGVRDWNIDADQLRVSLLPGERFCFHASVPTSVELDASSLFTSVNDLRTARG